MIKTNTTHSVHFVCRGNTYRSRLAAAYFYTLVDARFSITSSGIVANTADIATISPYAKSVADQYHLKHGIEKRHTQTTSKLLTEADVLVFMNKDVYNTAVREYDIDPRKCLIWNVPDIVKETIRKNHPSDADAVMLTEAKRTFNKIRGLCDDLHAYLTHTAWVDIVDEHNEHTGLRLPMAWATDRGLWHRGIHVVAQTVDGKYIVEKRSKQIVFAPGMLEVSLGGGVDSGEHPLQAAARETHEELGVRVAEKRFRPLFMYKQVGYHPHYKKQTKCHLYVYAVKLPVHSADLKPQFDEVAELRALSKAQVRRLLRVHQLRHFGRLKWGYKLYSKAVAYSALPL